jgi:hypothetical protein
MGGFLFTGLLLYIIHKNDNDLVRENGALFNKVNGKGA